MKRRFRRLAADLLTGSLGRLVAFLLDVVTAVAAHASARVRGRRALP